MPFHPLFCRLAAVSIPIALVFIMGLPASAVAKGVDPERKRITVSIATEPPSLDSSIAEDGGSREIIGDIQKGLLTLDRRLRTVPGVAERWEENDSQVTFYLRKNAKWSDGSPVTAHDFVFAWRRLVDPDTGASGSLSVVWVIENANEIITGELPPEELGVVAVDDHTLVAKKSGPIPFFLEYVSAAPFFPLKQSFVEAQGDRYAAEPKHLLSNGPFMLTKWVHGAELVLEKNPHY